MYRELVLVFWMILSLSIPAFAQEQRVTAADLFVKMQSKLKLTDNQRLAVAPIIEKYLSRRQELQQIMPATAADKAKMRSEMRKLKIEETQELSQFLSLEQMKQWHMMSRVRKQGRQ